MRDVKGSKTFITYNRNEFTVRDIEILQTYVKFNDLFLLSAENCEFVRQIVLRLTVCVKLL